MGKSEPYLVGDDRAGPHELATYLCLLLLGCALIVWFLLTAGEIDPGLGFLIIGGVAASVFLISIGSLIVFRKRGRDGWRWALVLLIMAMPAGTYGLFLFLIRAMMVR